MPRKVQCYNDRFEPIFKIDSIGFLLVVRVFTNLQATIAKYCAMRAPSGVWNVDYGGGSKAGNKGPTKAQGSCPWNSLHCTILSITTLITTLDWSLITYPILLYGGRILSQNKTSGTFSKFGQTIDGQILMVQRRIGDNKFFSFFDRRQDPRFSFVSSIGTDTNVDLVREAVGLELGVQIKNRIRRV